jgi:hypothetical protein
MHREAFGLRMKKLHQSSQNFHLFQRASLTTVFRVRAVMGAVAEGVFRVCEERIQDTPCNTIIHIRS